MKTTSAAGRAALMQREGVRLTAYKDTVGVWTIGCGHSSNAPTPPKVFEGMTITADAVDEILSRDLVVFEKAVNAADLKGRLSQNAYDASVSLCFNIGVGGFSRSTVARCIANNDMAGAADAFLLWAKPAVLEGRRKAERAQFLTPDAGIRVDTDKPVLASIEKALNAAAVSKGAVAAVVLTKPAPTILPVTAPPHLSPSIPVAAWWEFWKRKNA